MKVKSTAEIEQFLQPFAESLNVEIVEVEFKQGKEPALTIFIENEAGMDLDTLEKFHNTIDAPLDEFDPTFGLPYTLNVSSPGLDRPFKTERDYERNLQKDVEVKLFSPMQGNKYFEGKLVECDKHTATILVGEKTIKFEKTQIAKINQAIKFD